MATFRSPRRLGAGPPTSGAQKRPQLPDFAYSFRLVNPQRCAYYIQLFVHYLVKIEYSMSTYKQRVANRRNAQKSTGPRTEQGKARSSKNAVKHALTAAKAVVIEGEDPEEFEAWVDDYLATYRPRTPFRRSLVIQLAGESWRLQRVDGLEAAFTRSRQQRGRDTFEASRIEEYYKPVLAEAKKCAAELVKDNLIAFRGTYDSLVEQCFEELQAMAKESGHHPVALTAAQLAEVYQVGAATIFLDDEDSHSFAKLNRYKTTILNNMSRIVRLLEQEQKLTEVIDVSAGPETDA